MNDESTPKGAHESATTSLIVAAGTDLTGEDRLAAFVAGYEQGKAERIEAEITEAVQAALHAQALDALGMASRSAVHGPAFSQMVRESGERDD